MRTTVEVNGVKIVLAHIQSVGEIYHGLDERWSYVITTSTGKTYEVKQEPDPKFAKYSYAPALAKVAQSEEDREKLDDHRTTLLNELHRFYTR